MNNLVILLLFCLWLAFTFVMSITIIPLSIMLLLDDNDVWFSIPLKLIDKL